MYPLPTDTFQAGDAFKPMRIVLNGGALHLHRIKTVLKAPMVSALETIISYTAFNVCFQFKLAPLHNGTIEIGDDDPGNLWWGLPDIPRHVIGCRFT